MSSRMSYSSEPSEDGHMLPKTERETFIMSKKTQRGHSLRQLALVAVLSSVISVLVTVFTHQVALSRTPHKLNETLLPGLAIPQLGTFESVFKPEGIYRQPPSNRSREAWMGLFPKGKGYISTIELEKVGPIPQFIQDMPTDGSGRFCIAAFHQMHCLYLIQSEFHQALEGSISKPGPHTRHCIDYLRSSIMCAADTTLEPFTSRLQGFSGGDSVDGFDSPHQCRSYDQLYEWAERFRYNDNTDADHFNG